MAHVDVWWHRHWVRVTESALAHTAAIVVGFVMMVVGLGLGVTIIMLPAGLVIGLLGAAIFVGGLFARMGESREGALRGERHGLAADADGGRAEHDRSF
jgi:hypothetical protein